MVTRVDKKPIIYSTSLIRALKPSVISGRKSTTDLLLSKSKGYRIPDLSARSLLDDYEDIEYAFKIFGVDDSSIFNMGIDYDEDDDTSIRYARMFLDRSKNIRQLMRSQVLMESISKIQHMVVAPADKIYYGTEAVYQLFSRAVWGEVFSTPKVPNYKDWCTATANEILTYQSTYCLIHPIAVKEMAKGMGSDLDYRVWYAWDMFKKLETLAIRIGSRKSMIAHAFYSGVNKRGFTPSDKASDDFLLPLTGYAQVCEGITGHYILGMKYFNVHGVMCVLSHDDCINLSTMAQCYFRVALYFSSSNGYDPKSCDKAISLVKDIAAHCCRLIDGNRNFSNIIRSMHILSQGEFNDAFEEDIGLDLGWRDRSANYHKEAHELDPMGKVFHERAVSLAVDRVDRLNTCFIYHVFIGDEMLIEDLNFKVKNMTTKVRDADKTEWARFISFVKAYTLCRFMHVHKKKPKVGGAITLLNEQWAERCVSGKFTMPPQSDWGKVWIEGEYRYTDFADLWHLEAQDVAYVVKDSKGIISGKYLSDHKIHSELLMAMTYGNILDTKDMTTPEQARDRIRGRKPVREVVLTTAPKAENAKPSWKKRVTFAADCEFRKMQAEFDRNCRRVMTFVRGPSLGVDQCILEKQFADIADATATGLTGAICSHDISGWSESMDRERKFEFESVLINMFDKPDMINIKDDWAKITAVVTKQGSKHAYKVDNGSFQGFDGSSSTILHSMILIYCIDTARRAGVMGHDVKTNMATLIDDCIALMVNLSRQDQATNFWAHLKDMYLKLGFEVDDLKSIFSTIKAIYLSRRFMMGGEVPSDLKVFIKAHSSYEDPLRCTVDLASDIFGAMRGACDANGDPWFIYHSACVSVLAELAHAHNFLMTIPPSAAAIFALCPTVENGWGFPSIMSWATNDVTDKRAHFNAILELNAVHMCQPESFTAGIDVYSKPAARAILAIKSQAWRSVSYSNIFTNPFEAIREGPLKPDMLKRNAIQDILTKVAVAQPWVSLLKWNTAATTERVRELLIQSGYLHAPTLAALVNCMPDNYRLSVIGKATGSESVLSMLPGAQKVVLRRRVNKCAHHYFMYSKGIYDSTRGEYLPEDFSALTYFERAKMEREEFYHANGVQMTDHTFPDPVATFTVSGKVTGSVISPNMSSLRIWDKTKNYANRVSQFISDKGIYVPRKSGRVWEVTSEYAKGWDTVSQRIAMGLAIIARASSDGHKTDGLLMYFIKSWNELSNITPRDTHLIAIHGNIKRLDANPGSATHPIIVNRNILRGFNNKIKTALDAIPYECSKTNGSPSHLHDFLAHETAMTCVTGLMFCTFQYLGKLTNTLSYQIATRQGCIVAESAHRMTTDKVSNAIQIEIMDGADNFGLLQACPELVREIAIPTMRSSWVRMINALIDKNPGDVEALRREALSVSTEVLVAQLEADEVYYSPSVILAAEPASRGTVLASELGRLVLTPNPESSRSAGDMYTTSVRTVGSKFTRALAATQPEHISAATCIRSILWSRLKSTGPHVLSKILYMDPDADWNVMKRCARADFWRAIITEVDKCRKGKPLSEITMSAIRSLGVPGLHVNHSESIDEVVQAVASYFGANIRLITIMIADLITAISGRYTSDFSKGLQERVISNNPSVMNAKLRRENISMLVNSNIETYRERVEKLLTGEPTHRGDKRCRNVHERVVELRCRMYTYMAVKVREDGFAEVDGIAFGKIIHNCAKRVAEKVNLDDKEVPPEVGTFDDTLLYMHDYQRVLIEHGKIVGSGWNATHGEIGAKLAYETISMDANMIMNTKYAISAAELAPKIHRKVVITPGETPSIPEETVGEVSIWGMDDEDDAIDIDSIADADISAFLLRTVSHIPIPLWQALYTLVLSGNYSVDEVNAKLGTELAPKVDSSHMREAHFEDFDDSTITQHFPQVIADYLGAGVVFNPEWLDRDEADAYTTDEMQSLNLGFLF